MPTKLLYLSWFSYKANVFQYASSVNYRSQGLPARDIWSLGVMVQGSGQMGELLGRRRRRRRRRRRHLEIGV